MAFLKVNNSSSTPSDLNSKLAAALNAGRKVFKLELNANPTGVLERQAKGELLGTITNLGGCGTMKKNSKPGSGFEMLFIQLDTKVGSYDENDQWQPNNDFALNLSFLSLEETEEDKLVREIFAAKGKVLPVSSTIKETKISATGQRAYFDTTYGTEYANITFNDMARSLEFDEDSMRVERGLISIWFEMDSVHIVAEAKEHKATNLDKVFLKPDIIHITFEAGKTVYNAKPKNVVSKERLDRGIAAMLAANNSSDKNADGNTVLPEAFFEAIADKNESVLGKIGTGKKAHLDAKKALIAAVESGKWDFPSEEKLQFIGRRGFNIHYTMNDHQALMSSLKKQLVAKLGDAAKDVMTHPKSVEVVEEASKSLQTSTVEVAEEELPIVASPVVAEVNTSAEAEGWIADEDGDFEL